MEYRGLGLALDWVDRKLRTNGFGSTNTSTKNRSAFELRRHLGNWMIISFLSWKDAGDFGFGGGGGGGFGGGGGSGRGCDDGDDVGDDADLGRLSTPVLPSPSIVRGAPWKSCVTG